VTSTRVITAVALVALACLIAAAVALTTTPQPAPIVASHLEVGAGLPSTVTGILHYSDSSGIAITATVRVNVPERAAQLAATATISVVTASLTLRSIGDEAFLELPGYASLLGAPWTATSVPRDRGGVERLARVLRHPELTALHPTSSSTRRDVTGTTTTLRFAQVSVPVIKGLPLDLPRHGHLTLTVRTGTAGQVLSVTVHLWDPTDDVRASFLVTSYDQRVSLAAPPPSQVTALNTTRATSIFGIDAPEIFRTLRALGIRFGAS
jgi:hypothetical protein